MTRAPASLAACACALALSACGSSTAAPTRVTQPTPALSPADALATRVAEAAGSAHWNEVAELRFEFVVFADGTRRPVATHRWDTRGGRDRVTWTDDGGHRVDAIVDLETRTARARVDGEELSGEALAPIAEEAYGRWVNDSYWLVLPLKLLDPGVRRTLEAPRERDGQRYEILRLEFDHVGLTPGDRYWLFVDPATARIVRWEMVLEEQETPPRGLSWVDYRPVGPLVLAHDHVSDDGTRRVVFEGTAALSEVVARDFELGVSE